MFVPITSEVNIGTGMSLKEISTERIFTVAERVQRDPNVAGEDRWKILPMSTRDGAALSLTFGRQELAEKYFAEV